MFGILKQQKVLKNIQTWLYFGALEQSEGQLTRLFPNSAPFTGITRWLCLECQVKVNN